MTACWSRGDVDLDQVWRSPDGRVFRVVSIADDPTVELREIGTGDDRNYVISSLLFSEFALLVPVKPGSRR